MIPRSILDLYATKAHGFSTTLSQIPTTEDQFCAESEIRWRDHLKQNPKQRILMWIRLSCLLRADYFHSNFRIVALGIVTFSSPVTTVVGRIYCVGYNFDKSERVVRIVAFGLGRSYQGEVQHFLRNLRNIRRFSSHAAAKPSPDWNSSTSPPDDMYSTWTDEEDFLRTSIAGTFTPPSKNVNVCLCTMTKVEAPRIRKKINKVCFLTCLLVQARRSPDQDLGTLLRCNGENSSLNKT